ncbi:hypothetical protein ABPG72_020017 [Tetrahymena utriculariae]
MIRENKNQPYKVGWLLLQNDVKEKKNNLSQMKLNSKQKKQKQKNEIQKAKQQIINQIQDQLDNKNSELLKAQDSLKIQRNRNNDEAKKFMHTHEQSEDYKKEIQENKQNI